ncbi:outer membrane beta-barrel protein [Congregibacter litoralis]|uniref:outer membrane beta-barrel protein n=1 Tax=Congregibacter litoralis TaxID=393662 RepID=UPI00006AB897|nr:outer membrane beta-barrel protein [Congregibacter litoralis]
MDYASRFFDDKHKLSIGATRQTTEITIAATTENFEPTPLTLDDLGVSNSDNSYFIDYRYKFSERWSLFAGAYSFSGSGENVWSRDFNFDGTEFTANTRVRADLEIDTYMVDLLYTVHRSDNVQVLLGAGFHALDFGIGLRGRLEINGESAEVATAGTTLLAPVPNVRGSASWALNDRIYVSLVGGWLSANVDEYEGDFVYAHLRGFYRIGEKFGVSLGYQSTDIDIKRVRATDTVDLNAQLDGPTVTLTYSF